MTSRRRPGAPRRSPSSRQGRGGLRGARPGGPAGPAARRAHDKRNPFPARIIDNIVIVGRGSTKETRHIELDIAGSGLIYEPGDALGIVARNDPAVVAALIEAPGLAADSRPDDEGQATTLAEALESDYEIAVAPPRFLDHWAGLTGAAELRAAERREGKAERQPTARHHVVDIVRNSRRKASTPEAFIAGLRPLQPRLYSIASSLAAVPDEAHLTSPRSATICTASRARRRLRPSCRPRAGGDTLPVYVQANPHFRLPADDRPIIMVGAGTGVAPYRAFLQEREARGASGRSWLFFGERNFRSDFLYQTEWQDWLKDGMLARMDVAFSRDRGSKSLCAAPDARARRRLYAWLEDGAHLYVCGDAARMAPDVHER